MPAIVRRSVTLPKGKLERRSQPAGEWKARCILCRTSANVATSVRTRNFSPKLNNHFSPLFQNFLSEDNSVIAQTSETERNMDNNKIFGQLVYTQEEIVSTVIPVPGISTEATLGLTSKVLIVCVWIWSLIEAPWELLLETDLTHIAAVVTAKVFVSAVALLALRRSHIGEIAFAFVCAASVLAICVTLPTEYSFWRTGFYLSLVECILKCCTAIALAIRYLYNSEA